ncbi:hypothetical protein Syun_016153 [Stephania yunnanensis]|uniref:E1 ubiquitin-activating enzyme n=1 Tax=Stephania yunnanensis TaxID=152371 RepID=A0AAP0J4D4_9MAGN
MYLFEKKGFTLGVVLGAVQSGREKLFKIKLQNALKSAQRKSKGAAATTASKKLPFGLCGCQEETTSRGVEIVDEIEHEIEELNCEDGVENSSTNQIKLEVSVDEWQTLTIRSGGEEIRKWILNSEEMDFNDQIGNGTASFKGVYKGRRVLIQKMRGCEKGSSYEFELRRDLLELMTCGHRNISQFYGVCVDENHGLCAVTKMMEGGTVHETIQKRKKLHVKEVIRIAVDVAEGIKFMNDHGVAYKDLNSLSVWVDRVGNACVGDMGIVSVCRRSNGEATEYETDGYRWLAPEIIDVSDPESVKETSMSNVYSFGMVVWEMVAGEAAYSSCSPVQAAVGIAACGLRPEIPKDCPQYSMLPRKRDVVVEVEGGEANLMKDTLLKKHRIECLISCSAVSRSGNHHSGGEKKSSVGGEAITNSKSGGSVSKPPAMALDDGNVCEIDEDLHSRQLAVYGRETMQRLFISNVLISGMQGLGAEIGTLYVCDVSPSVVCTMPLFCMTVVVLNAKNLILAGVKSVTLHDEGDVEFWDLSSNFVFSEDDLGKNRALASMQKLQELNNAVTISTLTTALTKEQLSGFQAVVFTDIRTEKAIEFNDYCHTHEPPIPFIKAEVRGLFGSVFCDFGPEFTILDVDGKEPHTGIIASISNDNPAIVSCVDDERLEFQDGDLVIFSEVHGGIVTQVKQPKVLQFKPLKEALGDPGDFLLSDFSKFDHPHLLHMAFQALDKYICELGRFPIAGFEEDAQKLILLVRELNEHAGEGGLAEIDEKLLRHFAFGARAVLNPMAAMFGGIVGQEVVKACSGKFHPLFQFFYFDSVESLPTEPLNPRDFEPQNSRYDAQISVFGSRLQRKMEEAKVFIVGSGALGCEFLKNLALMGVSCGSSGKLVITDDDVIEKSNLSRQFLFRDWNIGQAKSTVAASAAMSINPHFNVEALQNRANPETENVFNDVFWENLDVVINALDNVNARLYIDGRCLYFQKPLLESGTLGTKCNTQMVIPHLTENYGASRDPPEKQAPMCTVHAFPHNIDHCLTWARSEFDGLLEKTPAEVNAYLLNPVEYTSAMKKAGDGQARDNLMRVLECLDKQRCETFEDCITWARLKFEDCFSNRVKQLTYTFPEDSATSKGALFWSAPKRFPRPLQFSVDDRGHLDFLVAASILRAETFNIPIPEWAKSAMKVAEAVNKVIVPDFEPKKGVKIETDEKATSLTTASLDDSLVINNLIERLEGTRKKLPPAFPKLTSLKAKFIAGRIIPAIATSTAMATGLVCLELYKVLAGGHKVDDYRNSFANLALPLFSIAEPVPPKVLKHAGMAWTVWDRWTVRNNPTLRELLVWLKNKGLNAYSITCGSSMLYNSLIPRHKDRMDRKVIDLAGEVAKVVIPPYRGHLDVVVACEDDNEDDVDIPLVSIYLQ